MLKLHDNIDFLLELGFVKSPIPDSYYFVLLDETYSSMIANEDCYHYKAVLVMLCNDKGKMEYYAYFREGDTNKRHQDSVVTLTKNLLYVEDLTKLLDFLKL